MKTKDYERWSRLREKGIIKYILIYGVLSFGVPLGILCEIIHRVIEEGLNSGFLHEKNFYGWIIARIIIYGFIGGPIYGVYSWKHNEKEWRKEKNKILKY